jgi:hypothetical protein
MLPLAGCARGNVELLEAQLRNREAELRSVNGQLELKDQELARSQREIQLLQQQLANKSATPEAVARLARIEKIAINSQLTGALDQDGQPGDDVLNVVVSPLDSRGDVVKLDGDIEIEALDPALPEDERSLGKWNISLEQAESAWHNGFIGQGYQLTTPWQRIPQSQEIILLARYKTPDGREFSATKNIPVTPAPAGTPAPLPLPQAKQETRPLPEMTPKMSKIDQASFEEFVKEQEAALQKDSSPPAKPLPAPKPVITSSTAPLVELIEPIELTTTERKSIPLPEELPKPAASDKLKSIPLPEELSKPAEQERPPFVE